MDIISDPNNFTSNGNIDWGIATGMNAENVEGPLTKEAYDRLHADSEHHSIIAIVGYVGGNDQDVHYVAVNRVTAEDGYAAITATSVNDYTTGMGA